MRCITGWMHWSHVWWGQGRCTKRVCVCDFVHVCVFEHARKKVTSKKKTFVALWWLQGVFYFGCGLVPVLGGETLVSCSQGLFIRAWIAPFISIPSLPLLAPSPATPKSSSLLPVSFFQRLKWKRCHSRTHTPSDPGIAVPLRGDGWWRLHQPLKEDAINEERQLSTLFDGQEAWCALDIFVERTSAVLISALIFHSDTDSALPGGGGLQSFICDAHFSLEFKKAYVISGRVKTL